MVTMIRVMMMVMLSVLVGAEEKNLSNIYERLAIVFWHRGRGEEDANL